MNRSLVTVFAVILFHQLAQAASRPMIPLLASELGANAVQVGLIAASWNAIQFALALAVGRLSDHLGPRRPALAGSTLLVLALAGLPFAQHWSLLLVLQAMSGLAHILVQIGYQVLLTETGPADERAQNVGNMAFLLSVSQAVGPTLTGFAMDWVGTSSGMWVAVIMAVPALVFTFRMPDMQSRVGTYGRVEEGTGALLRNPALLRVLSVSIAVLFATDVLSTYFPLYAQEAGLSAGLIGLALSVRGAAAMVIRPMMGRVLRWFGGRRVLLVSLIGGGLGIAAYTVAARSALVVGLSAATGLTMGLAVPLTLVLLTEAVPLHLRGQALALRLMGNRMGQTISPICFGLLAASFGLAPVFLVSGGLLILSGMVLRTQLPAQALRETG